MKRLLLLLSLAALPACDVCSNYCATECACAGDDSESCVQTCSETLDVYSGTYRDDECQDRLDRLNEECEVTP